MPRLTLSFDNGPEPETTPYVLDVLRDYGIKTTFFVIGKKLARPGGRALAERAVREGHWIGNHTFTHSVPLGQTTDPQVLEREIGQTEALIGDLAHPARLFRPFGGGGKLDARLFNKAAVRYLQDNGYTCVLWNAVPQDWVDPVGWVDRAVEQCLSQDWGLIVLHDMPTGAMAKLSEFLDRVTEAGIEITQKLPCACLPIQNGQMVRSISELIMECNAPLVTDEDRS